MARGAGGHGKDRGGEAQKIDRPHRDLTLQHPRCVFQILKRHFRRYTPELVEESCGVPTRARSFALPRRSAVPRDPNRTGAICYAVGWTQHSVGVQIIRTAAILQLLLGNIGRPGGGILALRGHASIQGSTDIPTLYDILPGYLPMPRFGRDSQTLERYIRKHRSRCRLVAQLRQVHRVAAEGVVRRRGTRERTSSASDGCRASAAITHTSATGSQMADGKGRWRACS